jgi:type IV pilus assembly protein PilO
MAAAAGAASGFSLAKLPLAAKIGVGVLLSTLIFAGYYVILHNDIAARIDNEKRTEKDLDSQLVQQQQALSTYLRDKDELSKSQQNERTLNKVLPAETETASFLSTLQQVSNVSGTTLTSWQPMEERVDAFYAKVPMVLEMTGRFHQVGKFMYEIGKQERIINIENVQMTGPPRRDSETQLKVRCLATTFHLLNKPAAAPTPAAGH